MTALVTMVTVEMEEDAIPRQPLHGIYWASGAVSALQMKERAEY